jgi:alpha-D-ribose 1-methylphosphonate 5-triphosphate synthase subunit PhnG
MAGDPLDVGRRARRRWMSVLAQAPPAALEQAWRRLGEAPRYRIVRGPEVGLVMVRARAGSTGARFNLGEMTVTRCSVQLAGGTVGHAYVGGRDPRHAELAALLDALLQDPARWPRIDAGVVGPLADALEARRRERAGKAAATRVEFFTMVRGEGA